MDIQFSKHHLLKRLSFPHCIFLTPLLKIYWLYRSGFTSGLSILFHWFINLFFFLYESFNFLKKIYLFIYLFIYFWLCWVFVSVLRPSPVAASRGHSSSRCTGLSLSRPLLLRSTGSGRTGSVVVAHGLSCSTACGIFPDQGSNPCPLHWQADFQPLRHQGSPIYLFLC